MARTCASALRRATSSPAASALLPSRTGVVHDRERLRHTEVVVERRGEGRREARRRPAAAGVAGVAGSSAARVTKPSIRR